MKALTMKALTIILGLLATSVLSAADLTITVDNIQSNIGNIRLAVFAETDKDNFPNGEPTMIIDKITGKNVLGVTTKAKVGKVSFKIMAPAGIYAVAAYQDENSDTKLNKSFFGSPNEPYGFSNDARATFSAPDFSIAQFELNNSGSTIIFDIQ